ncbi:MAG: ChaN family lipoprotein [Planctomycetaceae bacterium]|nr:ChaN family lipoprotein [Planctomycetaceae bacterium]
MPIRARSTTFLAIATMLAAPLLSGCTRYFASAPDLSEPSGGIVTRSPASPRSLVMFEGSTGRSLGWADVMAAASWADCTFIGERHDDPVAHAVQLAIFEDLAAGYPGTAIALEHLERDEQATVDRYLAGEITRDEFIDSTESRDWAGKDTWVVFFQPLVDAAREVGSPVVAANAPREAVREARAIGHDAMRAKPTAEQADFDLPITTRDGLFTDDWNGRWNAYFDRFVDIMSPSDDDDPSSTRERLANVFLSQSVWDGTMGASAARAREQGAPKVVLCAGCFHVERDGGTVLQFEARRPMDRVLTVTVIDDSSAVLREQDRGAADIVIYGFRPARPAKTEPTPDASPDHAPGDPAPPEPPTQTQSRASIPQDPAAKRPTGVATGTTSREPRHGKHDTGTTISRTR